MALLMLCLVLAGCSEPASPSRPAATAESDPPAARQSGLEGTWYAGPVSLSDLRTSMLSNGIKQADVDAWVTEVGSPRTLAFVLTFTDGSFTHATESPESAMQVDESGTYAVTGHRLRLAIDEQGEGDTYTFGLSLAENTLRLRLRGTTERGSRQDQAKHRVYTVAYYAALTFRRDPSS
jgi:hypothetical protein